MFRKSGGKADHYLATTGCARGDLLEIAGLGSVPTAMASTRPSIVMSAAAASHVPVTMTAAHLDSIDACLGGGRG